MILHLQKLLSIGLTGRSSQATPSKFHLPPGGQTLTEVAETVVGEEAAEGEEDPWAAVDLAAEAEAAATVAPAEAAGGASPAEEEASNVQATGNAPIRRART